MITDEKTCYNCGNKECIMYYKTEKQDVKSHYEAHGNMHFDCVDHDKWEEDKNGKDTDGQYRDIEKCS